MNYRPNRFVYISALLIFYFTIGFYVEGNSQEHLSLRDLPVLVQKNLPQLNAAKAKAESGKSLIDIEKRSLMPEFTLAYQSNIATFNNITGMSYPGLIMPISGPPSVSNNSNFIPGSAATAFITWQPITFGQRNAAIERAVAQYNLTNASYDELSLRYKAIAINTYLEVVYFKQLSKNSKANISRFSNSLQQSLVLAKNGLKPGIDTIQLQSSLAQAQIELLQNENNYKRKLIELSSLIGKTEDNKTLVLTDTVFVFKAPLNLDLDINIQTNPYYNVSNAQKEFAKAQLSEVSRTWRPKLDFWANAYGRGSGVDALGNINRSDGLNLSRNNLGAGFQLSFPVLNFYQVNAKKRQYQEIVKAEEFNLQQTIVELNKQKDIATKQYIANSDILKKSAIRLNAAELTFNSIIVSYETGLVDFTRLIQAQFELQQAEINFANAQLNVQRSILDISLVKGDLDLFFNN